MQEQFKKQNDEVYVLKKKLEEENVARETYTVELKTKFARQVEELNEQLDSLRKTYANVSKMKQTLEAENVDLANEVKNLNAVRVESERKRKQAESSVSELTHKLVESERMRAELADKAAKLQAEVEAIRTAAIDADSRAQQTEKSALTLKVHSFSIQYIYLWIFTLNITKITFFRGKT